MQSKIEQQVMASVGVIYAARQLLGMTALKCYALAASAAALWQLTWVHKVFANWAHVGLANSWGFLSYAVVHTHLSVQVAFAVAALAGASLVLDAIRTLARPRPSLLLPL